MCDVFIVIYDSIISFFYLGSDEKGNHKKALTKGDQASNGYSSALVNLTVDIKMRWAIDKEPAEQKKVKRSIERALQ